MAACSASRAAPPCRSGPLNRGSGRSAVSRPDPARLWGRPELRATILTIAGIIALWPRTTPAAAAAAAGSSSGVPQVLTPGPRTAPTPDDAALAPLRAHAALHRPPTRVPHIDGRVSVR